MNWLTAPSLPAIGEIDELDPQAVKRVVMCSGKVYYDLLEQRRKNDQKDVAIVRIEQLLSVPASGDAGSTETVRSRS